MGIKANFTSQMFNRELAKRVQSLENSIIETLRFLGNETLTVVRTQGSYTDQTGNLRSSTGFIITKNGRIVDSVFGTANFDNDEKGQETGRQYAEQLASKFSTGYALIVVAGMNYAAAVEVNKDVLTSGEIYVKQTLPGLLTQLKLKVNR